MTNRLPALMLAMTLLGCATEHSVPPVAKPGTTESPAAFEVPEKRATFSSAEIVRQFESEVPNQYLIGPGDKLTVIVAGRPELSGQHTVGPDGNITLPFSGTIRMLDLNRDQAAESIKRALSTYYLDVYITVRIDEYTSNRVVVLGRVEHPGVVHFEDNPTLIEVLSRAGGFPILRPEQVLTRCAVLRGNKILWLDLKRLLNGDLSLNIRLRRNDIVYIPDAYDTTVYVLGEVNKPGVYRLTPKMSFLDALGQAGGPNIDANTDEIRLIRPGQGLNQEVALDRVLAPDRTLNVALEEGDIVYVPRRGIAKIGYILKQINPFALLLSIQSLANNASGE
ncbi:MAG: polysaccharide export protein [Candidatus Competibacter sp.]|nr:polysaccharide export protein [Candidatus Competibacter sp.]MDG4583303.1 polysaccharide export protein [Candidatus Competibacter sp.]